MMREPHPYPEIYCDFNARMTDRGYSLERMGSIRDLSKLGIKLEEAVGKRFTFVADDADENGVPDDIMSNGIVIKDERYGFLALLDAPDDFYWRSQLTRCDEA